MSRWNHEPEWVPVAPDGSLWHFLSYKGKRLGIVIKIGNGWRAAKHCLPNYRPFPSLSQAKRYAETSLNCTDCLPKLPEDP